MNARDTIISEARKLDAGFIDDSLNGPGKFEGTDRELTASLYLLSLNGGGEGYAGDTQYGLHATLMFPYILTEDSQGFVDVIGPYDTMENAERAMQDADKVIPAED